MYEPQTVLQKLREERQYRSLETFPRSGAKFAGPDEGQILSFCSNDYLNLSRHPELTNAALYAIQHYGCGAGSSRLLSGHLEIHRELEERLASWSGAYEAALIFGSGYLANCGVLQAVLEPNARVLFDRLNHASLVDGLRLASGLRASSLHWERYRHGDMADLERRLKRLVTEGEQPIWVISDSVFSMDGDTAPLHRLAELSDKYRFRWIVDEAHAVGIYGPTGAGLVQELALEVCAGNTPPLRLPDFVTANFAKALGSYGGYCLCSGEWKEYLVNFSRSLIYSTGLPPASAAAALAATRLIERECRNSPVPHREGPSASQGLGRELLERSLEFSASFSSAAQSATLKPSPPNLPHTPPSPIIPIILGSNAQALEAAAQLRRQGILVKAIRSPTVPSARLRFSLSLGHSRADLQYCAQAINAIWDAGTFYE